jgi:hypothetical protein
VNAGGSTVTGGSETGACLSGGAAARITGGATGFRGGCELATGDGITAADGGETGAGLSGAAAAGITGGAIGL